MPKGYRLDIWKCKCETRPCYYLELVNENRDPKHPNFCVKDGNGSRWTKVKKFPKSVLSEINSLG